MAPTEQLTFYTAAYSPYSQRVHIALEEAGVKYTMWEFETRGPGSKPEWYYQINPLGKIPALTFGGPEVPPDQPSPESAKLAESMAILEFLADIFPDAPLLPADPLLRAKARTFTEIFRNYVSDEFRGAFFLGKPVAGVLQALEKLQAALPQTGFAAGEWSIAEAAVAPFITRLFLFVRVGLGSYTEENWLMLRDALEGERFARIRKYVQDIHERPSFKKTWGDDARQVELWKNHPGLRRRAEPIAQPPA
ncbi:thioredoxin-like protein [Trametes versicolor FP-101664 SS1]|uniref:thioredoxin-like protein n=1 Tax=Trametes versicolor (strain FP-101664) TaxID=717944 RepID=UPI0004622313|nr:thioredoxin-like protein [Trametes versicolor FP-101664 SS1]EIW57659.1 thioredoxin-like protein [Trametes versicolor FP-101664 SS1]